MVTEQTFRISGMSCQHCVMAVRAELAKLPGVEIRELEVGRATVRYDQTRVRGEDLVRAIRAAGYDVNA